MNPTVAILAGGLATRLRPITERIPKSLVEVAGRPFAEHQMELLRRNGLTDIVFLVGHLGEMVEASLGDGSRWNVRLRYVYDGPERLGTGGALARALPALGDPFFVLYGDSYLDCDYAAIAAAFAASGASGLMTVYRNEGRFDHSNVDFAGGRILAYDKAHRTAAMHHVDYGLGLFRADAFRARVEAGGAAWDLAALYQDLVGRHDLAGYEVPNRFYEIGSPEGLEDTRALLADKVDSL